MFVYLFMNHAKTPFPNLKAITNICSSRFRFAFAIRYVLID